MSTPILIYTNLEFVCPFSFTFTVLWFQSILAGSLPGNACCIFQSVPTAVWHETDVVLRDGVRPGPRHVEVTGLGAGCSANRQSGARGAKARAQEGKHYPSASIFKPAHSMPSTLIDILHSCSDRDCGKRYIYMHWSQMIKTGLGSNYNSKRLLSARSRDFQIRFSKNYQSSWMIFGDS